MVDQNRLTVAEFEKVKIAETVETRGDKRCRPFHRPLWQADANKIRRMAPIEFIGRYVGKKLVLLFQMGLPLAEQASGHLTFASDILRAVAISYNLLFQRVKFLLESLGVRQSGVEFLCALSTLLGRILSACVPRSYLILQLLLGCFHQVNLGQPADSVADEESR